VLNQFASLVGRPIDCALVFNDASPDWAGWENPWFIRGLGADVDWRQWATTRGAGRQLVITQNMFPSSLNNQDWRTAGAEGRFAGHARALARNLVAAGLGGSVIRLGHEANGTWYPDSIGSTRRDYALWRRFWRQTVLAMRSVPGAHFLFDWCVNSAWRPVPLADYYPGDDVVDIVGADAFDAGVPAGRAHWSTIWRRPGGLAAILRFAQAHRKPLSIPEWGIGPPGDQLAAGDDPSYVSGIARLVRNHDVAYQAYFYAHQWATELQQAPRSLSAYRRGFGGAGRRR
jgi:hypothetical protein